MNYVGSWEKIGLRKAVLTLLEQKFGELDKTIVSHIQHLTAEQTDALLRLVLNLKNKTELTKWLQQQDTTQNGIKNGVHTTGSKKQAKSNSKSRQQ